MECPSRMAFEPGADLRVFVGGVIVEDGVDPLAGRNVSFDGVEEADELLMSVLLHASSEDGAVQDIEGGEESCCTVAFVVVGHGSSLAGLERQPRLGAIQSLDLGLLIDGEHHGVSGRVHVQAHDVLDFLGEGRIVGTLEGSQAVGRELVGLPDALDRGQRQARRLCHGATGPVGHLAGRFGAGESHDVGDCGHRHRRLAGRSSLVPQQSIRSGLGVAPLPSPDRRPADAGAPGDFKHRQAIGGEQNNAGALDMFERPATITDDRRQTRAIIGRDNHRYRLSHVPRIA